MGSLPGDSTAEAMELATSTCGPHLRWLPDGETGERKNWTLHIVEAMRAHPDLEIARDGQWTDYDDTPRFRVRRGHRLTGDSLDFGYVRAFTDSYRAFQEARADRLDPDVAFQVGIPGALDMALLVLGPLRGLRHARAFREATVRQISEVQQLAAGDVLFQIEVPFELVIVARMPGPARRVAAERLGRAITRIARESPDGTRFGIHLCLGDLNHKAILNMKTVGPVVLLANAIAAHWPAGRDLEFVHAPFAGASQPPPDDRAFFAPLSHLRLPFATRFIAGLAYEHQTLEEQRDLLQLIEATVARRVGVSAACGLGRRTQAEAIASLKRVRELVES